MVYRLQEINNPVGNLTGKKQIRKIMAIYNLILERTPSFDILTVGFNPDEPATNLELVTFVKKELKKIPFGGRLLKVTGAASIPLSFVISHHVNHLYSAVGVFDPKLQGYVITVSHCPDFIVGDLIK